MLGLGRLQGHLRRQKQSIPGFSMMTINIQFRQHTIKANSGSAPALLGIQEVSEPPPQGPEIPPRDSSVVTRDRATQHVRRGPVRRLWPLRPGAGGGSPPQPLKRESGL